MSKDNLLRSLQKSVIGSSRPHDRLGGDRSAWPGSYAVVLDKSARDLDGTPFKCPLILVASRVPSPLLRRLALTTAVVGRLFSTLQVGTPGERIGGESIGPSSAGRDRTGNTRLWLPRPACWACCCFRNSSFLLAIDAVRSSKNDRELLIQTWGTEPFVRLCVGLMFVPPFSLATSSPDRINSEFTTQYFAGLGLPFSSRSTCPGPER